MSGWASATAWLPVVGRLVVAEVVLRPDEDEADLRRPDAGRVAGGRGRGGRAGARRSTSRRARRRRPMLAVGGVGAARGEAPGRRRRAAPRSTDVHGSPSRWGRGGVVGGRCGRRLRRPSACRRPWTGLRGSRSARRRPRMTSASDRDDVGHGVERELVDRVAPGLQRRRQGERRAEQVGAGGDLERLAGGEHHDGDGDEATALGHVLEPRLGVGDRQVGAADAGEHPADDRRRCTGCGRTPMPLAVEHLAALAGGPQHARPSGCGR